MFRSVAVASALLVVGSAHSFVDNFDGSELLPHWQIGGNGAWVYSVDGGRLKIQSVYGEQSPLGVVTMSASFPALRDFRFSSTVNWANKAAQSLRVDVGSTSSAISSIGYSTLSSFPTLAATAGGGDWMQGPAPMSGNHEFEIVRTGAFVKVTIDRVPVATFVGYALPANKVTFTFSGRGKTSLQIDRVAVLPPIHRSKSDIH